LRKGVVTSRFFAREKIARASNLLWLVGGRKEGRRRAREGEEERLFGLVGGGGVRWRM